MKTINLVLINIVKKHFTFKSQIIPKNLRMNLDARHCASELSSSKNRHAQVDSSGINGIEPFVEFKLFCGKFSLSNRGYVKNKLFKDTRISEAVSFEKNTFVD
jgi:hypothetical protein